MLTEDFLFPEGGPPTCVAAKDREMVKIMWRDSHGRRCTTWRTAQEIGDSLDPPSSDEVGIDILDRINEVLNLPDNTGKGLALTGKGYCLLYRIRTDLAAMFARRPDGYLTPRLIDFSKAVRTNCPPEDQERMQGEVSWTLSLIGDGHPVTDRHGVTHRPIPLFRQTLPGGKP